MGDYTQVPLRDVDGKVVDQADNDGAEVKTKDEIPAKAAKPDRIKAIQLFRFGDKFDAFLMIVGTLAAMGAGTCFPITLWFYADVVTAFVFHDIVGNMKPFNSSARLLNVSKSRASVFPFQPEEVANIYHFVRDRYLVLFLCLYLVSVVLGTSQFFSWTVTQGRQMKTIRKLYFRSLMSKDVGWFDVNNTRMMAAKFASDMNSISLGLGTGAGVFCRFFCGWFVSTGLAFSQSWKMSLACLSTFPLIVISAGFNSRAILRLTRVEKEKYAAAGAIAEETFSGIRTVAAFGGQEKEHARYTANLEAAEKMVQKKGVFEGLLITVLMFINFSTGCIAIGLGAELYINEDLEPGQLVTVLFLVIVAAMGLVRMTPYIQSLTGACETAFRIYPMIEEFLTSKEVETVGLSPKSTSGYLEMRGVTFSYPARPNVKVLDNVSFKVEPGQTVALVGHTGCGKSTVVQLIERFYPPQTGSVLLDGMDTKELDVQWLRRQIGFVGQEPVLFATTIAENIRYGNTEASVQDIVDAATLANAHSFIKELPKGYDTYVGDSGCQLSGGEKQRIAIARALLRKPQILLLDEATSALDSAGELLVQQAIERAQQGRTTLVIAHRLSTVVGADQILVMKHGKIVESGNHQELLDMDGYYTKLVKQQLRTSINDTGVIDLQDEVSDEHDTEKKHTKTTPFDSDDIQEEEGEIADVASPVRRLVGLSRPERPLVILGCCLSLLYGMLSPIMAIVISEMLAIFELPNDEIREKIRIMLGTVFGLILGFAVLRQVGVMSFSRAAAKLTTRIRERLFSTIVYQDMEYFDERTNRVGVLTNRLSTDAITIHGASAVKLGFIIECTVSMLTAVVVAFVFSWKLSFVVLCLVPISMAFGFVSAKLGQGQYSFASAGVVKTAEVLQEVLTNIRLVRALASEEKFKDDFDKKANNLYRTTIKKWLPLSIAFSISESNLCLMYAVFLTYGAYLVQYEQLEVHYVFRVFMVLNQGAIIVGGMSAYAENFGKAKTAATRVFNILDRTPNVNINDKDKKTKSFSGGLALENVTFHYPCRPDVPVLRDVTLAIRPGQKVALVGVSGCGKTTLTALMERFYDPVSGTVRVDGDNIRDLDLRWYRSQIGMVSQEPTLFDRTIAENIQYGDNSREVSSPEVIQAARTANVHKFVTSLPKGYDTMVGDKGRQLSGGEKQRVAIARALIRDPKLLILDEATSALDAQNEQIVQEALEQASEGRTTIVIAHRLSTVQRCDRIAIIHEGRIAESGSHEELLTRQGIYYKLVQAQAHGKRDAAQ